MENSRKKPEKSGFCFFFIWEMLNFFVVIDTFPEVLLYNLQFFQIRLEL